MSRRSTAWPVQEVCWAVGLGSVGSFTGAFRRMFGVTPTAWRKAGPAPETVARVPACVRKAYGRPQRRTFGQGS